MTLLLTRSVLEQLVDPAATVAAVRAALCAVEQSAAFQPAPSIVTAAHVPEEFLVMAASGHDDLVAAKLMSDIPANAGRGLPTQRSAILITRLSDGVPVAILDGKVPTRERTAAATAVATDALARPDSVELALIGAGGLAAPHVRALCEVRQFRRVTVWSRSSERIEALRLALADVDVEVRAAPTPQGAVQGADVICTLTPARHPVLAGAWLEPGQHVNAVGAPPRADHREIDSEVVRRSRVFLDDVATAMVKSGDVLIPLGEGVIGTDALRTTLGAVLNGTRPGRTQENEITLYNSVGIGVQDLAVSALYIERARARGLGLEVDLAA